jgi:hypothetical protein
MSLGSTSRKLANAVPISRTLSPVISPTAKV